jgi:putative protein kinase ArgK-like GTPase of G3E family
VEWLAGNSVPFVLVFTKTDRVSAATVRKHIAAFTDRISGWSVNLPEIFTCSATTKQGRKELLAVIEAALVAAEAESGQTLEDADVSAGELPAAITRQSKVQETRARRPHPARPW